MKAILKTGPIGAVLVWALLQNQKLEERSFSVIEGNTRALAEFGTLVKNFRGLADGR